MRRLREVLGRKAATSQVVDRWPLEDLAQLVGKEVGGAELTRPKTQSPTPYRTLVDAEQTRSSRDKSMQPARTHPSRRRPVVLAPKNPTKTHPLLHCRKTAVRGVDANEGTNSVLRPDHPQHDKVQPRVIRCRNFQFFFNLENAGKNST